MVTKFFYKPFYQIIGGVILIFVVSVGAYRLNQHSVSKPAIQQVHTRSTSPKIIIKRSPIPTGIGDQNNLATWSIYTYNHDFSIAYPPYWNVILDQDGNGVSFMTAGFHQDDDFSMPYGNSNEVVYTIFGQNDTSDMKLKDGDQFPSDTTSETLVVTHLQHLPIAGIPAVEFDYYPTDNVNFLRTRVSIQKGDKMFHFNATYAQNIGKQLFEEMMQSLKFIQN